MAESTLTLGFPEFRAELGHFVGYGRDSAGWSSAQGTELTALVQAGYRRFLVPSPLPGERVSHEWSFLRVVTTITLTAEDYDTTLPDDFGQIDGSFTFAVNDGWKPVSIVPESMIRDLRQRGTVTGKPEYAAIRPRSSDGASGQRFEVIFWPSPDAAYVLSYRYAVQTYALSASYPYALGGMAHCETVMASILAMGEERLNDMRGTKFAEWMERLVASVERDRKFGAEFFGYNGDGGMRRSSRDSYNVTYGGVQY